MKQLHTTEPLVIPPALPPHIVKGILQMADAMSASFTGILRQPFIPNASQEASHAEHNRHG